MAAQNTKRMLERRGLLRKRQLHARHSIVHTLDSRTIRCASCCANSTTHNLVNFGAAWPVVKAPPKKLSSGFAFDGVGRPAH
jgi:hypothetical protein